MKSTPFKVWSYFSTCYECKALFYTLSLHTIIVIVKMCHFLPVVDSIYVKKALKDGLKPLTKDPLKTDTPHLLQRVPEI